MSLATVSLSAGSWLGPALALLAVAAAILYWSYRASPGAFGARWVCVGLKLLGLAALAACLLEPLWSGQRARPGANLFAVLADNSQGLQIKDRGENRTRGELLRGLLRSDGSGWQSVLADHFDLRRYFFDMRLQATKDFGELTLDGRASMIQTSVRQVAERFRGRPLAGILLFTDGNATDAGVALPPGLPPVYPVVLGTGRPVRDVAIAQVHLAQTAFEDAPVSIQADVTAAGCAGEPLCAELLDPAGKIVGEATEPAPADGGTVACRFRIRPAHPGLSFYRLRVLTAEDARRPTGAGRAGSDSREATLANNERVVVVDRGQGPYRVLYVAGRPNWEYKFLNRAILADNQVELVGLVRVARREPKFDFRGRAGETSNPLYRGFGNQAPEQVAQYDQPVLVRLNTRDALELRAGFPRAPEDLYGFHAVILDDVEAEFFAPDQALLLQKFVAERGGGLLMLGGVESFQNGGYQRTPIGDLVPVYLDRVEAGRLPGALRLNLTREGWLQPWARLRDSEPEEEVRLREMVPFQVFHRVRDIKPGASVIASVKDEAGAEHPALVVQRFGRGRAGALLIGDLWRWGFKDAESQADLAKAWRQMIRWLIADVPPRVELQVERPADEPGPGVSLQVRVRDAKFTPVDNATVTVAVQPVDMGATGAATNLVRLRAEPSTAEAGRYDVTFVPRATGGYRAVATVTNSLGAEVGRAEAGWSIDLAAEEFRSLTPNRAGLEALAKQTGGEVIAPGHLDDWARALPRRQAPVMESWSYPLWHTPAMFAFALACLSAEWGLRRWKGWP